MSMKLIAASALALSLAAGAAFAQSNTSPSQSAEPSQPNTTATTGPSWTSDDERMMYQENTAMMGGFFTDDTMSTLKSDDEIKATFEAMGAEDQAAMKTACERAAQGRSGSYGSVTTTLCAQAGVEVKM